MDEVTKARIKHLVDQVRERGGEPEMVVIDGDNLYLFRWEVLAQWTRQEVLFGKSIIRRMLALYEPSEILSEQEARRAEQVRRDANSYLEASDGLFTSEAERPEATDQGSSS